MKSRIWEILSGFIDMFVAGLLWLLCSLPVVTLGASSSALYYATVKSVRHNRGSLTATFFKGFRDNFRFATAVWLFLLLYILLGLINIYALGQLGTKLAGVLRNLCLLLLFPPLFYSPWIFAYLSRFENSLIGSLKFTFWLMVKNIGTSLLLAAELVIFLLISWLVPLLIPLLPGAVCLTMSLCIEPVFRPLQQNIPDHMDAWFNE